MHTARRFIVVFACAAVILACDVSSIPLPGLNPTPTPIAAATETPVLPTVPPTPTAIPTQITPTETLTPTPTAAATNPPGVQISYGSFHFLLPTGLGSGLNTSATTFVEFPYMNAGNGDMPQHLKMVINGYPIQGTLLDPQILVFNAAEYSQYAPPSQGVVSALQDLQYMDGQPLPSGFPAGPFSAHVGLVSFANGRGLRYLTQVDQGPLPINNQELIYYFNGLTSDNSTYVEVILPIQAAFLAPDGNPNSPLPQGGIPFNTDDIGSYLQAVADKLNATPPDQFTPSLPMLDALVQSISIK